MDLKKHGFWLAMGGGALLALLLYVVLVPFGVSEKAQKESRKLGKAIDKLKRYARIPEERVGDPRRGLPIPAVAEYWRGRRGLLEKEHEAIAQLFGDRDKELEKITGGYGQNASRFAPEIRRDLKRLDQQVASLLPKGKSLVQICEIFPSKDQLGVEQIPVVQKRYYIVEALTKAALAAGADRVESVKFEAPSRTGPRSQAAQGGNEEVRVRPIQATAVIRMAASGRLTAKTKGPRAKVLRELRLDEDSPVGLVALASAVLKHPKITFRLTGLKAEKAAFAHPEFKAWKVFEDRNASGGSGGGFGGSGAPEGKRTYDRDVYIATQDSTAGVAEPPPPLQEPAVKVTLTVEALDFEVPEVRANGR